MIHVRHHDQVPIEQQVVRTAIEIPVRHHDQVPIEQQVVPMVTEIPVHRRVQAQIVHVAKTHTVAIAHALVMTVTHARHRVTANAVDVQIVPAVVSPMIAKNVHEVALAKSA